MKVFAIFFCVVIRFTSADFQRVEIDEDVLKLTRKAAFPEANETTNENQDIVFKDDHVISGSSDVISGSSDVISGSSDVISGSSDVSSLKTVVSVKPSSIKARPKNSGQ